MKNRSPLILGLLVVSLSQQTHAADGTWNVDANGTWSTPGNWLSDIADGSGFTAHFTNDITADRTVSLDGDRTLSNLIFGDSDTATAGSWILNNNGTSTNNLILAGTTPTITVNALGDTKTATISAIIEGSAGLVKAGAGRLDLTGANTFTGGVTIKEGRLSVSGSSSSSTSANPIGTSAGTILLGDTTGSAGAQVFGASTGGTYTIANALTVRSGSAGTKEFGAYSGSVTYSGPISLNDSASFRHLGGTGTLTSSGGITVASGKTLTLNPNSGTIIAISVTGITGLGAVSTAGSGSGQINLVATSNFSGGFTMSGSATLAILGSSTGSADSPTAGAFGTGTATLNGGSIRSTISFDATIHNTLNLSGTITGVTLASEKSVIFSGTGTLTSNTTFASAIGSTVSGKSMTFSGNIGDGGNGFGITTNGAGEVVLSGANTFSGATKVTAGRLTLSNSLALQNSAFNTTDSVTGSTTAGLKTTVTTLTFGGLTGSNALASRFMTTGGYSGVTALTLNPQSGSVSYSGAIAEGAAGMTLTKKGAGTQILTVANSYTGGTIVESGILSVNDNNRLGTNAGGITLNGGTLTVTGTTTDLSARPSLVVGTNGGTYNKTGTGNSSLPNISGAGNTLNVSGANGNSGLIVFKQTGTNTLGTLNFSANNTSVDFGTNTSIDTINLSSATHIVNLNTGGASANVGAYDDVSFTLSNGGMIRNRWGQNTLSTAITLAGNGVIANRGTTEALTFSGNVSSSATSGTQTLGILTDTLNGHQGTVTQTSGSVISDGGIGKQVALTVGANSTSGTVTLAGTNTYTGTTTVNGGTLVINGNQSAATGDVTVNNAGTRLKGSGTIGGDTTVNAGAIHSVGNSVGTQTFHDGTSTNLTYAQGSIFEWELGALKDSDTEGAERGTDWDAVNVSGTLGTTGTGAIFRVVLDGSTDFADSFWLQDREWTDIFKTSDAGSLVAFESVFTSFQQYNYSGVDGALANLGDVSTYGSFAISGSSLTWTAVPEPTSALAGLLIAAGLLRRRRQH